MTVLKIIFVIIVCSTTKIYGRPQQTRPGCWYEGKRYQESQVVNTTEPCLRCRCNEGSLRCRLRVCPRLPSPPPSGCTTRTPRDNACCAELVCGDSHERNVTARRDPAKDIRSHDNGCVHEGVRYAPGSAMMGSRRCEYCYCISGNRKCLRPRCLLPLAGCTPLYSPYSCCPVAYNCTNSAHHSVPSQASPSSGNGCRVGSRRYDEGEMVRDIAEKAECDNCFCAMGGVRCVPLACAPPLQGCTPIVREGHCCPSTYNCSGSIEVKAAQNFASYAFISKDYAKFRKETNFFSMDTEEEPEEEDEEDYDPSRNSTVEGRGHKNDQRKQSSSTSPIDESSGVSSTLKITTNSQKSISEESTTRRETTATTRSSKSTTIANPETETMDNEIPTETMDYGKSSTLQQGTTFEVVWTTVEPTEYPETLNFDTTQEDENFDASSTDATAFTTVETADSTNSVVSLDVTRETSTGESSTVEFATETTDYPMIEASTTSEGHRQEETSSVTLARVRNTSKKDSNANESKVVKFGVAAASPTESSKLANFSQGQLEREKNISQKYQLGEQTVISVKGPATGSPTTIVMPDNILVMNVTLKTNVSVGHVQQGVTINPVRSIPPDIEAILNITHRKKGDDYDYEYSQPTLPPSLPNVRIIPFVAADALVKNEKEIPVPVTSYPIGSVGLPPQELGPTVAGTMANFYDIATQENRFSPPIETEGGFVPREPPYFDPLYHSTDLNLEIHTGVTVVSADITNPHRKNDELATNCRFENRDFRHGDLLPSSGHCIICICYYGEVACSDEKCPPLKIGCRRLENEKICCGTIICVASDESPTVVLDRADPVAASPRQPMPAIDGVVSPDPFRDVIKTEPAPDLPSLIEDMLPYLAERRITKPSNPTTPMTTSTLQSNVHGHYQLESNQKYPIEPNSPSVYPTNDSPPSKFNGTSIDRTLGQQIAGNSSTRDPIIEDPSEFTTTPTKSRKSEAPTLPTVPESSSAADPPESMGNEDSSLFSFGSVFDLLFSENTETPATRAPGDSNNFQDSTKAPINEESEEPSLGYFPIASGENVQGPLVSSMKIAAGRSTSSTTSTSRTIAWIKVEEATTRKTTTTTTTVGSNAAGNSATTSSSDNEIGTSVNSLLKLAGCNIYGRMYRVGRIITELSSPCLECRCTEVGVQCKQLEC